MKRKRRNGQPEGRKGPGMGLPGRVSIKGCTAVHGRRVQCVPAIRTVRVSVYSTTRVTAASIMALSILLGSRPRKSASFWAEGILANR